MLIQPGLIEGYGLRLEPASERHREAVRALFETDPDNWRLQLSSALGQGFAPYWQAMTGTPDRIAWLIFDGEGLAGTSSLFDIAPEHRSCEIGFTWYAPRARGGRVNPAAKLLMMEAAFGAGARRVQFKVDARNARSLAAMAKLGAVREGVLRRHLTTWTGHARDSAIFSVLDEEWPKVQAALLARLS